MATEAAARKWWKLVLQELIEKKHLTVAEANAAKLIFTNDRSYRDTKRHYAATITGGLLAGPVYVHRDALDLPGSGLVAILLHEIGHVLSASAHWCECPRAPADEEKRADYVIEKSLGCRIRYDKKLVQTLGTGVPRPSWLT